MADEEVKREVVSRKEAKRLGLKRYYTGLMCIRSHIAERFTTTGKCVECNKLVCSGWQKNNREWIKGARNEWYAKNAESQREYHREWYARDVETRREQQRARRDNPETLRKHNERNAKWREENPDYFKEWKEKNPEQAKRLSKASKHRWRAKEAEAEGSHTSGDLERIYELQRGRCAYCRIKLGGKYQVDHIIPLSKGGTNWPNNLQLA